MYCENCGNKILEGHKFCTKCGHSSVYEVHKNQYAQPAIILNENWWHRLLRVLYVILYIPLFIIIPIVWNENISYSYYRDSYSESFWYSVLTFIIYILILRLIKLAVIYIAFGRKPEWKKEFKKPF